MHKDAHARLLTRGNWVGQRLSRALSLQGEPAGIQQLQMSNPQTGTLRLNHQVFLAAYGGDRVFLSPQASTVNVYLKRI